MNWTISKQIFIKNIQGILKDIDKSQTDFNIELFGEDEKGKPKNNLWRSDQSKLVLSVVLRAAEILNRSVDELTSNIPLRGENHPPGSKKSLPSVGEPSPIYNKAVTELFSLIENPEMASKLAQGLVGVLKRDPERFYNKFYYSIIDDCYMLERIITKNRRKSLRIMN